MKRSKNHHKLISGDKPHIYLDKDDQGLFWTAQSSRRIWDDYTYLEDVIHSINDKAS